MGNALELVRQLIALPAPPGQEAAVRDAILSEVTARGCASRVDARGNVLVAPPGVPEVPERADIVVMAHMDEIALMVVRIDADGRLVVTSLGGLYPWKWGEGPVDVLTAHRALTGILSFGSIHTESKESPAARGRTEPITWQGARIFTGLSPEELKEQGVRPGTRVVLSASRRTVTEFGDYVAAPFLDDRADLASWLLALESLPEMHRSVVFAATTAEEVGGLGALYLLRQLQPEIGIALEVGPIVPENPFALDEQPTVWVNDSYAAMQSQDIELVAAAAEERGLDPHWQAFSRGGSDASCAASHGLVARSITLAFAAENSHGYEIMHKDAVPNLTSLLLGVLGRLEGERGL